MDSDSSEASKYVNGFLACVFLFLFFIIATILLHYAISCSEMWSSKRIDFRSRIMHDNDLKKLLRGLMVF